MKRLFGLLFVVAVLSNFVLPAYAFEVDDRCMYDSESNDFDRVAIGTKGSENEEDIDLNVEPGFSDYTVVYRNTYEYGTIKYGNFRNGTSGGSEYYDSVLSFNNSNSAGYDLSFVASVSGEYSISNAAKISLDLGVSLGASDTYELNTGFSVNVPQGKRVMIKYRPAYYRVKVTETEYWEAFIIGGGWQSFEMGTKVSYVNVFSHWDYDAVELTD